MKTLHLKADDLQIFKGRYTLHRVSPLSGTLYWFSEIPDMIARCLQLYDRALPTHHQRNAIREDLLLD